MWISPEAWGDLVKATLLIYGSFAALVILALLGGFFCLGFWAGSA